MVITGCEINCGNCISNSSSFHLVKRKNRWNEISVASQRTSDKTIKNKNFYSRWRENYRLLNDSKMQEKTIVIFFDSYAEKERERQRKFYEFFTVVYLTHMSSAMAWPLWEISTSRNLSLQFYSLALETLMYWPRRLTGTFGNRVCCL